MVKGEFNVEKKKDIFLVYINPQLISLDVIYTAAYVFLEKAYIVLDGDIKKTIIVKIKPKPGNDGEKIAFEFNNELIKYSEYKKNVENNKELRQMILQKALSTNDPIINDKYNEEKEYSEDDNLDDETKKLLEELENEDDCLDDPDGIAIPWEEKYIKNGKKNSKISKNPKKTNKKKKKAGKR